LSGKIKGKSFERKFRLVDEFAPELDALAGAIHSGKPVEPDGRQGHRDMLILEAIYESARKAQGVDIKY
jgi:predicted dehydrogenase